MDLRGGEKAGPIWIVGYGNRQRRDDGIGQAAAEALEACFDGSPGVRALALHQLGPELAEDFQGADLLVFIDAAAGTGVDGWRWVRIRPEPHPSALLEAAHTLSPATLLGIMAWLYRDSPPAWLVTVQGEDFGFGEGLSEEANERTGRAVAAVARMVRRRLSGLQDVHPKITTKNTKSTKGTKDI